jgi:AhpD family alkylhydroperoxidase
MARMAGALALQHVAWETCLIEPHADRAVESYARRKMGMPFPPIRYFVSVPWLARALVDLAPEFGLLMHLDHNVADLVALVVSQENSCRFCFAAVRAMLWAQGMSEERIQRVEQNLAQPDLLPRTAAAVAFGRSQSGAGTDGVRDAREALRCAGVGDDEMREIAYVVAKTHFSNRVFTIPAIPSRMLERMPDRLPVRLLRPLFKRILERNRFRGRATPLGGVPPYPYGGLVEAYACSPIAPALGRTIEEMWTSSLLTRRCKLLMQAVVARGLGCEPDMAEFGVALRREGLSDSAQAQILTHLDAPELDPVERLLVRFARETIWYEPEQLQRRARALRDHLSGPQLLEAIGVVALANGLCRLGAMVLDRR